MTYKSIFLFKILSSGPSNRLNECLSSFTHVQSVTAKMLAARGSFLSRANSPKSSPSLYDFTSFASSPGLNTFYATAEPDNKKYKSRPSFPCFIIYSPFEYLNSLKASATYARS